MLKKHLPDLRRLALSGAIHYTKHALIRMMERDIDPEDIETILTSISNQLIECQSPSNTSGREHADERVLIYDPKHVPDIIVVCCIQLSDCAMIHIITVENPTDDTWEKDVSKDPALVRK